MKRKKIVVATRKSELALAQCRQFLARLVAVHPHLDIEELHVTTTGDRIVDRPLSEIGGKGLFLKEIEEALIDGSADLAVHSMKDVPPELHPELCIGCIPEREDPRDVLVTTTDVAYQALPAGSLLGTSSLRRAVQLSLLRPDLRVVPIRGNVGTRIRKCKEGEVDATVLARAGLNRLAIGVSSMQTLSTEECLPAVGQGALAIEHRKTDQELGELLSALVHPETEICVAAERGVMTAIEGDCKTPVAAYAERSGEALWLRALLAAPDGGRVVRREVRLPWITDQAEATRAGLLLGRELKRDHDRMG